jgi:hypothetical protein
VRLAPGTYLLIILNNVRGAPDGARLVRVDVEGETPGPADPKCNMGCSMERGFSSGDERDLASDGVPRRRLRTGE